ncbi:hypothetical protein JAO29_10905 [Edaphobacter sp. HDX4]|uniref:hypothetical protein n=1 Tax=Edaphobacter sp. HDX4 TaxID=2794064 RepID=UPI002FE53EC2
MKSSPPLPSGQDKRAAKASKSIGAPVPLEQNMGSTATDTTSSKTLNDSVVIDLATHTITA